MARNKNTMQVGDLTITPEARSSFLELEIGGKKARVHYKELWGAVFVLGKGKYRDEMLPVQKQERMVFSRKLQIQAKKDIKKGETITVWTEFDVAQAVVEAIGEREGVKVLAQEVVMAALSPGTTETVATQGVQ